MRVLQVNKLYYPWIGGVERHVQDLAEGIHGQAHVEVLVCQPKGKGVADSVNGVKVTRAESMGMFWGMPVSFSFPFVLRQKAREADIVHLHSPFPLGEASLLLAHLRGKKVIVTYHSDIVRQKAILPFYGPLLKRVLSRADAIVVTSPNLRDSSPFLRHVKEKCRVIPLGIDIAAFQERRAIPVTFPNPQRKKIVLFVGRLVYYKGLEYLLCAMQKVDALLLIVGEGPLKEKLQNQATTLGVAEKAVFLGRISDEELKNCYEISDVFVLPSVERTEAFGLVQLEAMLAGLPVGNTSLSTGVPFVSVHGETGLTVPPRDASALAGVLQKILQNPTLAENFGRKSRERVREMFSEKEMIQKIQKLYQEVLAK